MLNADAETPHDHPSSTAPPVPVDNSHEAMERRGELHALLEGCLQVEGAVRISREQMAIHFGARCVELCASHGVDDVAAMLAVIAEERS